MSESRRPRTSPAVFRRRRLVVVLMLLVIIVAVVWLLVSQPWRSAAAVSPEPTPSLAVSTTATSIPAPTAGTGSTADAEAPTGAEPPPAATPAATDTALPATAPPEPTPTAQAAAACTPGNVTVDAVTDQSTYPMGQNPRLSIRLTNHGSSECALNVGTTGQVLTVTSGADTWWRSTDCQTEPSDMIVLIAAGKTVSSATPVEWDRSRSSVSTCDGDRPHAPGGGASYHLSVSIGGIPSTGSAQFLLY